MTSRLISAVLICLAVAGCGEPTAPVEPAKPSAGASPKPAARESLIEPSQDLGGVLPLKHGIFVSSDISCGDPPNAAIRRYDGVGLSGAHTRDCRIKVLEKRGASYDIDQSCIDAGSGPAPRSSERATVEVRDNLTFTLKRGQGVETFRYCAASLLPPGIGE